MHQTTQQVRNVARSTARMQISDTSKQLSNIAGELDDLFETAALSQDQQKQISKAIETINNISLELA